MWHELWGLTLIIGTLTMNQGATIEVVGGIKTGSPVIQVTGSGSVDLAQCTISFVIKTEKDLDSFSTNPVEEPIVIPFISGAYNGRASKTNVVIDKSICYTSFAKLTYPNDTSAIATIEFQVDEKCLERSKMGDGLLAGIIISAIFFAFVLVVVIIVIVKSCVKRGSGNSALPPPRRAPSPAYSNSNGRNDNDERMASSEDVSSSGSDNVSSVSDSNTDDSNESDSS